MSYLIKEELNSDSGATEYVVIDNTGVKAPPPNTFATKGAAVRRLAEILRAEHPSPGKHCYGKIVAASDTLLIQHLGREYALHRRDDSEAFKDIEVGDLVQIIDGEVEYPSRTPSSGLSL